MDNGYIIKNMIIFCIVFLLNIIAIKICDIYKIPIFILIFIYSVVGLSVVAIGVLLCIINKIKVFINKKEYFYVIMLILVGILFFM